VRAVLFHGSRIYAGTAAGVFVSTNGGAIWARSDSGLGADTSITCFLADTSYLLAGTTGGLFVSIDSGASWSQLIGMTNSSISALTTTKGFYFAGAAGDAGVFVSSQDTITTWNNLSSGMANSIVYNFAVRGFNVFAGTPSGVYLSSDTGDWVSVGLTADSVEALAITDTSIFAGTPSGGVWRESLSSIPTDVKTGKGNLPLSYALYQNYPNPFNPSTVISYQLPTYTNVTLKIYDVLGREVETLVDTKQQAGAHIVRFDGSRFASGVYFYRLTAGSSSFTRKMLLLK